MQINYKAIQKKLLFSNLRLTFVLIYCAVLISHAHQYQNTERLFIDIFFSGRQKIYVTFCLCQVWWLHNTYDICMNQCVDMYCK